MTAAAHELDAPPWRRLDGTIIATGQSIRKAYDRALSDLGLTLPEASLLAFIAETDPQTQTQLAEWLGNGKAALGARIDRLEQTGAIQRLPHSSDRRVWLVHLTDKGSKLVVSINDIDQRLRAQLRRGVTREQRQQLAQTLMRIQANLDAILQSANERTNGPGVR